MHSASLELCDGMIRYRTSGSPIWELAISDVRIVGEMTNNAGPFDDDYSLCFAAGADGWYDASFYAEGREEFLQSLAMALQCELPLRLVGSTDFDSNVLWPPHLAGKPMFLFKPEPAKTWIGRLMGASGNTQWFSADVLQELRGDARTKC